LVELLAPTSLAFNDNADLLSLQVTVRSDSKRMPLQLGNARHIYEHDAQGIITQTCRHDRLENQIQRLSP
jgi:hypothetical protein